jgi:hypothetical protein
MILFLNTIIYHQLNYGPAFRSKSCLTAASVTPGFPLQSGIGIQPHCWQQHLQSKTVYKPLGLLQKKTVAACRKPMLPEKQL